MTRAYDDALIATLTEVAERLADTARQSVLPLFRTTGLAADNKRVEGFDPVTEADRAAEIAMRDILNAERPADSIIGEEFGPEIRQGPFTWVLDPIDGTRGFISGTPTWGVLIAVADDKGPFLGLIDQPYIGERFLGTPGRAWMTGPHGRQDLVARKDGTLADATLFTTFPEIGTSSERAAFDAVAKRARLVRFGMDCYAYALLAGGHIDLVIEAGLEAYDVQAPIALIEAAGGCVTDWSGGPAHAGGRVLAAANRSLHAEALAVLRASLDQEG